jgi:hypothetical protein
MHVRVNAGKKKERKKKKKKKGEENCKIKDRDFKNLR